MDRSKKMCCGKSEKVDMVAKAVLGNGKPGGLVAEVAVLNTKIEAMKVNQEKEARQRRLDEERKREERLRRDEEIKAEFRRTRKLAVSATGGGGLLASIVVIFEVLTRYGIL